MFQPREFTNVNWSGFSTCPEECICCAFPAPAGKTICDTCREQAEKVIDGGREGEEALDELISLRLAAAV